MLPYENFTCCKGEQNKRGEWWAQKTINQRISRETADIIDYYATECRYLVYLESFICEKRVPVFGPLNSIRRTYDFHRVDGIAGDIGVPLLLILGLLLGCNSENELYVSDKL